MTYGTAHDMAIGAWVNLSGGTPLSYSVSGSDVVHVMIGRTGSVCELVFDSSSMRALAELATEAMAKMDTLHAQEMAAEQSAPGRHHLHAS